MQTHPSQRHGRACSPGRNQVRVSKRRPRAGRPGGKAPWEQVRSDCGGFLSLLLQRIGWEELNELNQRRHGAGRPAWVLSRGQLLAGLVFHCTVGWAGSLAEHLFCLLGIEMAESSLSQRRQALPFEVFSQRLRRVLRPICRTEAAAFFGPWRLVAIDGVRFSLPNTPQVKAQCPKGCRGAAAFAKLQCTALVELMLHNPLAARVGRHGESEWKLALGLLEELPQGVLLLADRLYGCGAFVVAAMARLLPREGRLLVRVARRLKVRRQLRRYADGSCLVEIGALDGADHHRTAATVQVREIYGTVQRKGHRPVKIRLWTSLSCTEASAQELIHLYMSRWEQELYFRELKWHLGLNDLLRSQTPETAAQELAAMIIGSSLIAQERAKLKPAEQQAHRISFIKTWETLQPLWLTLLLGADILSEHQKQALCERFYRLASRRLMPKKRSRSCSRSMRQPFQPWPRTKTPKSVEGPVHVSVLGGSPRITEWH
jgi:hypothetical protein